MKRFLNSTFALLIAVTVALALVAPPGDATVQSTAGLGLTRMVTGANQTQNIACSFSGGFTYVAPGSNTNGIILISGIVQSVAVNGAVTLSVGTSSPTGLGTNANILIANPTGTLSSQFLQTNFPIFIPPGQGLFQFCQAASGYGFAVFNVL